MRAHWTTAFVAGVFLASATAQATDTKEVHQTVALDRDGRVSVDTYKGSIDISTWDRPEVRIDARIEADDSGWDSEQKRKVALTQVRVSGSGGSVSIRSDYDAVNRLHRGFMGLFGDSGTLPFVRYTIQMPAAARLEIKDYKSDTKIAGLKAGLRLETYKGTVRVTGQDGATRVETYKGDVKVEFARFSGDSRFETHKGDVEVRLPKDSRFDLEADAGRHGDIESDFAMTTRASRRRDERTSGAVNGGGPKLNLTTYKGTLRIRAS